jgi:hypothetical protein
VCKKPITKVKFLCIIVFGSIYGRDEEILGVRIYVLLRLWSDIFIPL